MTLTAQQYLLIRQKFSVGFRTYFYQICFDKTPSKEDPMDHRITICSSRKHFIFFICLSSFLLLVTLFFLPAHYSSCKWISKNVPLPSVFTVCETCAYANIPVDSGLCHAACLPRSLWSRNPGWSERLKKKKRLLMFANRAEVTCWLAHSVQITQLVPYLMQKSDCGLLCHVTGRGTTAKASPQRSHSRSLSSITLPLFSFSPSTDSTATSQHCRRVHNIDIYNWSLHEVKRKETVLWWQNNVFQRSHDHEWHFIWSLSLFALVANISAFIKSTCWSIIY